MAEWFKAADCKSVESLSSKVRILLFSQLTQLSKCNAVVACLLWEQKVMCSNHIILNFKTFIFLRFYYKF